MVPFSHASARTRVLHPIRAAALVVTVLLCVMIGSASSARALPVGCTASPGVNDRCPGQTFVFGSGQGGLIPINSAGMVGGLAHGGFGAGTLRSATGTAFQTVQIGPAVTRGWTQQYAPQGRVAYASGVVSRPSGSMVFVVGSSYAASALGLPADVRGEVVAYRGQDGRPVWTASVAAPRPDEEAGIASAAITPDGRTLIVGEQLTNPAGLSRFQIAALDTVAGRTLWKIVYGTGLTGGLLRTVAADARRVYLTGATCSGIGVTDSYCPSVDVTAAFDLRSGARIWATTHTPAGKGGLGWGGGLRLEPDGHRVFVSTNDCGSYDQTSGCTDATIDTIAYDPAGGRQLWLAAYHQPGGAEMSTLAVDPRSHAVYVSGGSCTQVVKSQCATSAITTLAYDSASGGARWAATLGNHLSTFGETLAVSPDGTRIFAVGITGTLTSGETVSTGGPAQDSSYFLGIGDLVTVAYDAAGKQQWSALFNSGTDRPGADPTGPPVPEWDFPSGAAVSADGRYLAIEATFVHDKAPGVGGVPYDLAVVGYPAT